MELRHLRYFVAVAETGTFSRAAARLRITQPALWRQVHDLEGELGVRLFERSGRRARVTSAGEGPASRVNKALVAFIACMLVGVAAFSASTNLHRFAK